MSESVKKDLNWIKQRLQTAVELEYSTLPLYLSAMFSFEVQNYTAYNTVRSVAMEEMVHMAIAANLLAALGGRPAIRNLQIPFPTRGLPGGAEPDLNIGLAQFSKNQLENFMRIERPQFLIDKSQQSETYPTIGTFYNDIKQAIQANRNDVVAANKAATNPDNKTAAKQVPDSIGLPKFNYDPSIDPVEMLRAGIDEIMEQGEGNPNHSIVANAKFEYEESHYAKFASLYYGRAYSEPANDIQLSRENEAQFFTGPVIGWPEVINVMAVPSDGFAKILALDPNGQDTNDSKNVGAQLDAFDIAFSNMLMTLDTVWNHNSPGHWQAINTSAHKMINYDVFQHTAHLQESVGGLGSAVHGMMDFRVFTSFNINKQQIPNFIIQQLSSLYPNEFDYINKYTDLSKPVFYSPRYRNINK